MKKREMVFGMKWVVFLEGSKGKAPPSDEIGSWGKKKKEFWLLQG